MPEKVFIKNMVCPRCITAVQETFEQAGISLRQVELGWALPERELSLQELQPIRHSLQQQGFEVLEDRNQQIIAQIKSIVIEHIHYRSDSNKPNLSEMLAEKLHQDYSSLSKLFSSIEGSTIERYSIRQKIEKVKEMILYDELTLSEIAFQLHYSSVAHLSAQFKKETGISPSAFKKQGNPERKGLDEL